jgi:hypothetical protein
MYTKNYPDLYEYRLKWYAEGKKILPDDLELSPGVCLHWYIGDGNLRKDDGRLNLYTLAFTEKEVIRLINLLDKKGLKANMSFHHGKSFIYFPKSEAHKFLDYIGPCPKELQETYGYKWNTKT